MTEPFPFNPPIAPQGFPNPLSNAQTLDDINLPYLTTVISYANRLKKFVRVGHDIPDLDSMMAQTVLYQAQVTDYLLYKSHPDDPVFGRAPTRAPGNSNTSVPIQDMHHSLQNSLNLVVSKLTDLDSQIKHLNKTTTGLASDLKTLQTNFGRLQTDVGTLKTDVGTLKKDVGTLKTDVGTLKKNVATLQTASDQNKSTLTELAVKVTNLANTDEFSKAVTEAVSKNEFIKQMELTVSDHTKTLGNIQVTVTGNSETLTRLQTSLQRIDRVQCQTFNASRNGDASWLPVRNGNNKLPSDCDLTELRRPDDLNRLSNLDIFKFLEFYNYHPPTELSNEFKSSTCRKWSLENRGRFLDRLRRMLIDPATSFTAMLPETPEY